MHKYPHPTVACFIAIEFSWVYTPRGAFALGPVATWRADSGGLLGAGRRLSSRADLITLLRQLQGHGDTCAVAAYAPSSLRPPPLAVRV